MPNEAKERQKRKVSVKLLVDLFDDVEMFAASLIVLISGMKILGLS